MKLKTSLFSKGLIISDIKRFWWISALYTLILFFVVPFNHYIQKFNITNDDLQWVKDTIIKDLTFENQTSAIFLIAVPIIIGALVFRFMQKSRSASLYHSLPYTRTAIYFTGVLSSLILFIAPLLVTTIIMFLLSWFSYLSAVYTAKLIFTWLLYSLLFGVLFLSMSIFVGMFTGNSVAHLAFVYILNFLPIFLVEFIRVNLRSLLFGFDTYSNQSFYYKMPMVKLFTISNDNFSLALIIIYIFATAALFTGGLAAFKLRRPETAGDIITFRPVRPIFIYGVTACAAPLGGTYFLQIGGSSFIFAILGYFISSIIAYIVVQMITNKSFKVLHTCRGYIGFGMVLLVLALGMKFDLVGYEKKIPEPGDVKEVYVGNSLAWWQNKDEPDFQRVKYSDDNSGVYKDPQNIENITRLHQLILDNRSNSGSSQYIAYKLKNGKQIIRHYSIDTELYASALGPVYESSEYKSNRFPIVYQEPKDIKYIEIYDIRSKKNQFIVSDKPTLDKFKTALRKDIENLTYRDLVDYSQRAIMINIIDTKNDGISYSIRASYKNTLEWLKNEGIYNQIILKPEDVRSVIFEYYKQASENQNGEPAAAEPVKIEITDKSLIKEIIDLSFGMKNDDYDDCFIVYFNDKNSRLYSFSMNYGIKVSPELQSYIDKLR